MIDMQLVLHVLGDSAYRAHPGPLAKPEMSIHHFDVGMPMHEAGFSQGEIMAVLNAVEQDKIVAYAPGNGLLILKHLPG